MKDATFPLPIKIERLKSKISTLLNECVELYDLPMCVIISCAESVIGRITQGEYELLCNEITNKNDEAVMENGDSE